MNRPISSQSLRNSIIANRFMGSGILSIILCICIGSSMATAQQHATVIGAGAVYELPLGTLHTRFLGSFGGMVYAGVETSPQLTWVGKLEYVEFSTINSSALTKVVTVGQGTSAQQYKVPLPKLSMTLKTVGVTAEAHMNLLRTDIVDANGVIGFGFTNWVNTRSKYYDSLYAIDASTGSMVKVAALAVPASRQEDWSGTFNLGLELSANIVDPVWITVGVDYKMIVGELWQTLDLDLENIAGMQFVSIRSGIHFYF